MPRFALLTSTLNLAVSRSATFSRPAAARNSTARTMGSHATVVVKFGGRFVEPNRVAATRTGEPAARSRIGSGDESNAAPQFRHCNKASFSNAFVAVLPYFFTS